MTDDFSVEIVPWHPSDEVVSCAKHIAKVLSSLSTPDLNNILTCINLVLVQVVGNMNFKTQADRDLIPSILAQQLKRNLALIDAQDRLSGNRASRDRSRSVGSRLRDLFTIPRRLATPSDLHRHVF